MGFTIQEIAEAFSRHDFEVTYPHMVDDIRWNMVGSGEIVGKEGVTSACGESAEELADVQTKFSKFRTVLGEDTVVVDTTAEYTDKEKDVSRVASCDIYDFTHGKLSGITSYNVALST